MTHITWKTFRCKLKTNKQNKNGGSKRHIEMKLQNYIVMYLDVSVFLCSYFTDQKKKKNLAGIQNVTITHSCLDTRCAF